MKRHGRRRSGDAPLSLLGFFTGRVTLTGDASDAAALLDLCTRCGLSYGKLWQREDGCLCVTATDAGARLLCEIAARHGIALAVAKREGLREALGFLHRRKGILVGSLLAVLLTVVASTHLWEIRVTGNETLSGQEVVRELSAAGLSIGDFVPEVDVDSIENRLLMHSERISWISVNLIGTVAEVQIREKLPTPKEETDRSPANLVARCDGVVIACEVLEGNLLVKVGTPVRKGEVLVSGLYDSATLGIRYTRARGAVYAETEHELRIEVPYAHTRTALSEMTGRRCTLLFFGKELSLYRWGDLSEGDGRCAVGESRYLTVFGRTVPIGLYTESYYEERTEETVYTRERAMEIAYYRLNEAIRAIEGLDSLLEKSVTPEITEDAYILNVRVRCIENVAETKNIEIASGT